MEELLEDLPILQPQVYKYSSNTRDPALEYSDDLLNSFGIVLCCEDCKGIHWSEKCVQCKDRIVSYNVHMITSMSMINATSYFTRGDESTYRNYRQVAIDHEGITRGLSCDNGYIIPKEGLFIVQRKDNGRLRDEFRFAFEFSPFDRVEHMSDMLSLMTIHMNQKLRV